MSLIFRLSLSQVSIPVRTMDSQDRPMRRSRSPWRSSLSHAEPHRSWPSSRMTRSFLTPMMTRTRRTVTTRRRGRTTMMRRVSTLKMSVTCSARGNTGMMITSSRGSSPLSSPPLILGLGGRMWPRPLTSRFQLRARTFPQ